MIAGEFFRRRSISPQVTVPLSEFPKFIFEFVQVALHRPGDRKTKGADGPSLDLVGPELRGGEGGMIRTGGQGVVRGG